MTLAILSLLAAVIPFGIWLWKRRAAREDDPQTRLERQNENDDAAIAAREEGLADINRRLAELEQRLPDSNTGNPS